MWHKVCRWCTPWDLGQGLPVLKCPPPPLVQARQKSEKMTVRRAHALRQARAPTRRAVPTERMSRKTCPYLTLTTTVATGHQNTMCGQGGGWHKASVSDHLPLEAPIGLSPLTLCGPERVLVVSTEPPDDLSCLTTPGVGRPGDGAVARAVDPLWAQTCFGCVGWRGGGGGIVLLHLSNLPSWPFTGVRAGAPLSERGRVSKAGGPACDPQPPPAIPKGHGGGYFVGPADPPRHLSKWRRSVLQYPGAMGVPCGCATLCDSTFRQHQPPPPPPRSGVVWCASQQSSTRQHNKGLISGTIGAIQYGRRVAGHA